MDRKQLFAVIASGAKKEPKKWQVSPIEQGLSPNEAVDTLRANGAKGFIVRDMKNEDAALARVEKTGITPDTIETAYIL